MDIYGILSAVAVINRDNGKRFTCSDRLDAIIKLLWNSKYRRINSDGLFHLYAAKPLEELPENIYIISAHVDCESGITKCFTKMDENGMMLGTYDNAITNAAVLSAMLSGNLPDSVCVCFTGDEECGSHGAKELAHFLSDHQIHPQGVVVLDVTDMGWKEQADFTIENNFWKNSLGKRVIAFAQQTGCTWRFVPSDPDDIPKYVDCNHVIPLEAEEDESWEYDERQLPCFSFCIPICGEMHSNAGVFARKISFENYCRALSALMEELGRNN